MPDERNFFATTPKGLEKLLAAELRDVGATAVRPQQAGVSFNADLATAYKACLWSRIANRILLPLSRFPADSPEALYAGVQQVDWSEHLRPEGSLAVNFNSSNSAVNHTHYGALKVKDAVVDQFRERFGVRPSVDRERPELRINVYINRNVARLSLDIAGESLHRRGYRANGAAAPLKENLAAGLLKQAGWLEQFPDGALIDPMCGSGTLPIEAALMAADIAPGLLRDYFGFKGWLKHDELAWQAVRQEALQRRDLGLRSMPRIFGFDRDSRAVQVALENVARAGLKGHVHIERRDIAASVEPHGINSGLVIINPPYGERLNREEGVAKLYTQLGKVLRSVFPAWSVSLFTGNPQLLFRLRRQASESFDLYNGALECKQLLYPPLAVAEQASIQAQPAGGGGQLAAELSPELVSNAASTALASTGAQPAVGASAWAERKSKPELAAKPLEGTLSLNRAPPPLSEAAEMLANRLRKNLKGLKRWQKRNEIHCYRLYDADLPEYSFAIDLYEDLEDRLWVHCQEYAPPKSIDHDKAEERRRDVRQVLLQVLEIPADQLSLKTRQRQKGLAQYEKLSVSGEFVEVMEGGCRLLVNFQDYLDTGLFLDHRITRSMVQGMVEGKRFLNLFAYTGSVTVHAARGGAASTTTVDMSSTYLTWAKRNLLLNGFSEGEQHQFIQADCVTWLAQQARLERAETYDLIFLDPPTFSNSKRMDHTFDVQRDHVALITRAARLLKPKGVLIFSTNYRKFKLDMAAFDSLIIEDISAATIPKDFSRNSRIHYCWKIRVNRLNG